LRNNDVILRNN